ncbi:MAG: SDR family oxidoreductase [Dehalococcoidia bacterium]|nr:MAG: SDR family oxidoreductase [Dehalococcoidia bacterium]
MYDLKGKVAIVTGAGRKLGIGRAIALRLAREGADVAVADICREFEEFPDYGLGMWDGLKSTADEISALGVRGLPLKVDVTDSQAVDEMVAQTMDAFGHIDILVNNAGGVVGPMPVLWIEEAAWNKTLAINATGTFLCSQRVARTMIARREGGKIINISSIAGKGRAPALAAYCAAKAAVLGLTRVLAFELAASGIQVNAVCPGQVDTELQRWGWELEANFRGVSYDEIVNEEIEKIPLGKLETTDDVANLVAFLASDQSDYMTGQAINVDGGIVMH